jgi:hypothetical protein
MWCVHVPPSGECCRRLTVLASHALVERVQVLLSSVSAHHFEQIMGAIQQAVEQSKAAV